MIRGHPLRESGVTTPDGPAYESVAPAPSLEGVPRFIKVDSSRKLRRQLFPSVARRPAK
jgi:hypothetical protein